MIGGNSLIGNFALIKDMNPKMQVRSKNPGANPKIQGGGLLHGTLAHPNFDIKSLREKIIYSIYKDIRDIVIFFTRMDF